MSAKLVCFSHAVCLICVFQMFTSVRVLRLSNVNLTNQGLNKIFTDLCENLLKVSELLNTPANVFFTLYNVVLLLPQQSFYFKLRSMIPCCLCHLNFTVAVPEEELIQVGRSGPFKYIYIYVQTFHEYSFSFFLSLFSFLLTLSPRLQ